MNTIKSNILSCLFLMCFLSSYTQITQAEYFIDTDPGNGNGIVLNAMDGTLDEAIEEIFKNGISIPTPGLHSFNVRVKDANGSWGPIFKTVIYSMAAIVPRNVRVASAEIFWDTDPGEGNGVAMLAFDGNFSDAVETVIKAGFAAPVAGLHKLNIRVKDAANSWGPVFSTVVKVDSTLVPRDIKISQAELFWDTDPGVGNGALMIAFNGAFDEALETIINSNVSSPSTIGAHKLGIRVKDASNNWGPVFNYIVDVDNTLVPRQIKVAQAELFWDNDPGAGNGVPLIAFDGGFDQSLETVLNANTAAPGLAGLHKLNVRIKEPP